MTCIIDGKKIAANLKDDIAKNVQSMSYQPGLAVILVGDDPASQVYVGYKIKACAKVGIHSVEHKLPATASDKDVADVINTLNNNNDIDLSLIHI